MLDTSEGTNRCPSGTADWTDRWLDMDRRTAALADWHAGQEPREERGLDDRAMRRGQRVKWLWKLTMGENIPERDKNGQKKGVAYGTVFYADRSIVTVSPRLRSCDEFVYPFNRTDFTLATLQCQYNTRDLG